MLRERERDVLRLLGTDLSGPDMARELMVSLNTLRTHTKNSYAKREVNTRHAAVRRAEDLDLFSRPRTHPTPGPGRSVEPPAGALYVPHRLPMKRSPQQSPHVVMPSHHMRVYPRVEAKHHGHHEELHPDEEHAGGAAA